MTKSSLTNVTIPSPNHYNGRAYKITKITPHHMAGNLTVETCGRVFQNTGRSASSNYGIGTDGRIGCYVEEENAAWTSSNWANDNAAVTIEVANSSTGGDWPVSDAAWKSLVNLCVDICRRNGIPRLNYTGDASGNLTEHQMFASTNCPGPYLHARMQKLADEVNSRLGGKVGWIKDNKGWWYRKSDGSYPYSCWFKDKGKWYWFDSSGYMKTGWLKYKNKWYYLDPKNGDMKTGWVKAKDKSGNEHWYWFDDSGAMFETGFKLIKNKWYAFDGKGAMLESLENLAISENGDIRIG